MTGHLPRSLWLCLHDYTVFKQPHPFVTAKRSLLKFNLLAFQRRASLDPVSRNLCARVCVVLWEWWRSGGGLLDSLAPLADCCKAAGLQVGLLSWREAFHEMHVSLVG